MKKICRKATIIYIAFCVAFTTIPFAAGSLDVAASSPYWKKFKAKASGQTAAFLTWSALSNAQQKKISGIAIYRNGKLCKKLAKTATSFTDTGLKAGTKYSYKVGTIKKTTTYTKYWKNRKTGKLQKKAPKKSKRKKFKKVTVKKVSYSFKNESSTEDIKTAAKTSAKTNSSSSSSSSGGTSGGGSGGSNTSGGDQGGTSGGNSGGNTSTDEQAAQWIAEDTAEDTTTYIEFNGVRVHKGQTWTTSLYNQLASGANGTWSCYDSTGLYSRYSCATYLFNTNTYNPFVAIYVANGKVSGFHTNAQVMFTYQGRQLVRNQKKDYYGSGIYAFPNTNPDNGGTGVLIAGVGSSGRRSEAEHREVGFHFINAARYAKGIGILQRSKYLEGVDKNGNNMTWTGTIPEGFHHAGTYLVNARYGAQAWAESMAASHYTGHDERSLTAGPLYNANYSDEEISALDSIEDLGLTYSTAITSDGENAGNGSGEWMLYHYSNSSIHYGTLLNSRFVSIGVGWCDGYHCERFSMSESEGW